jgi:thioredoxin 1
MAGSVATFTDQNFQADVVESQTPVLVDFWAPWCGPCKMIAPTIEQIAGEYEGRVKVGKLNTDDSPQTATSFRISAIPTVLVFKGGQVVDKFVGVVNRQKLVAALDTALS